MNKRAENNSIMCQKLIKFDRSCRLINVPHCNSFLTDLTLIDINIILINNKITVKAAFNSRKCIKFSRNFSASGDFGPYTPYRASPTVPERVAYKLSVMMYSCMHGQAPQYLMDFFTSSIASWQQLQSASRRLPDGLSLWLVRWCGILCQTTCAILVLAETNLDHVYVRFVLAHTAH